MIALLPINCQILGDRWQTSAISDAGRALGRDRWATRLNGLTMASDGCLPFRDNIDYAAIGGVTTVVELGGSRRTPEVHQAAHDLGVRHITTGLRLFDH